MFNVSVISSLSHPRNANIIHSGGVMLKDAQTNPYEYVCSVETMAAKLVTIYYINSGG